MPKLLFDAGLDPELVDIRSVATRGQWESLVAPTDELLSVIATWRPDLVVLDDANGDPWSVVVQLQLDVGLRGLKVVLVHGDELSPDRLQAMVGAGVRAVPRRALPTLLVDAIARELAIPLRTTLRATVSLEIQGRSDQGVFYGRTLDLSTGGVRIEAGQEFTVGEELYCFFSLGDPAPVIFASARVAHVQQRRPGTFECGLEFAEIRLEDRRRIAQLVMPQASRDGLAAVGRTAC